MIELITDNDLDGIACIALAKIAFGSKNVKASRCGVSATENTVLARLNPSDRRRANRQAITEFHITDLRVTEAVAKQIDNSGKSFQLFDHHETSLCLDKYSWCHVAATNEEGILTCATELYYKWLLANDFLQRSEALDRFVAIVRDYDTWRWAELGANGIISKTINDLLYIYGPLEFYHWAIRKIENGKFPDFNDDDFAALNKRECEIREYVQEYKQHVVVSTINSMSVVFVFSDKYPNELGHELCQCYPEADFVAMINSKGRVSYRTEKETLNLSEIVAKYFGGGGQRQAAGSEFTPALREHVEAIGLVA